MGKKIIGFFQKFGASIRVKITIPYFLLSLIIALGGAYLITNWLMKNIDNQFDSSLKDSASICADIIVQEEDLLLETLRLAANTSQVWESIAREDAEALREAIYPLAFNSNEDLIAVLGMDRNSILTLMKIEGEDIIRFDSSRGSNQFSNLFFIRRIFTGQQDSLGDKYAEVASVDGELMLLIAGPIKDEAANLAGVVVVGRRLQGLIEELKQETFHHVSIYRLDGQLLESTLFNQNSLDTEIAKEVINHQGEEGYLRNFELLDHRYRELVSVFELRGKVDFGLMGVTSPTSYLEDTNRQTRFQVFTYMTVLLFLTLITGIYISRLITNPIQSLKSAALKVSMGDLDVNVEPIGEDEIAVLTQSFNDMIFNLKASKAELLDAYDKSLEGWAKALELRDRETEGHTRRVTDLTVALSRSLGIGGDELENIRRGAMLHDIGKVGVPDQILHKPGKLTEEEFEVMKKHPQFAFDMLSDISFLQAAIDIPYCHHEKWDGSGYPRGLQKTAIPLAARIFAVVDVWDAVSSDRIYRPGMTRDAALQIIQNGIGSHFDPKIAELFIHRILPTIS